MPNKASEIELMKYWKGLKPGTRLRVVDAQTPVSELQNGNCVQLNVATGLLGSKQAKIVQPQKVVTPPKKKKGVRHVQK